MDLDQFQRQLERLGVRVIRNQTEGTDGRYFQVLDGDHVLSFTVRTNGDASLDSGMRLTATAWSILDLIRNAK